MEFTVLREKLSKGLQTVNRAVNVRSPLAVLSNILIRTEKGRLKITASNLQITISAWVGAKVDKDGEITVPARLLTDFVSQITDEKLNAIVDGSTLKISTAKAKATFMGIPASEFPEISKVEKGVKVELDSKSLLNALQKVQFAVATDEGRPVLTGMYLNLSNSTLTIAGTDGFRMAEYKFKLKESVKKPLECVVPARALFDIVKAFSAESKKISLTINLEHNLVFIKIDDMEAHLRMIEGEYPNYSEVVPDEFDTQIKIAKEELTSGIKLASIFSRDMGNMIKIIANKKSIEAISQPTEAGSNSTEMKGEFEGENLEITFNAKYLLDFLTNIPEDEIEFKAGGSTKPGLFNIVGNKNYFYLVMPMKANW